MSVVPNKRINPARPRAVFKRERDARGLCAGRWTEWGVNGVVEAMR